MSDLSPTHTLDLPTGVEVTGELKPGYEQILSRPALELVAALHRELEPRRQERLAARSRTSGSRSASPAIAARMSGLSVRCPQSGIRL